MNRILDTIRAVGMFVFIALLFTGNKQAAFITLLVLVALSIISKIAKPSRRC